MCHKHPSYGFIHGLECRWDSVTPCSCKFLLLFPETVAGVTSLEWAFGCCVAALHMYVCVCIREFEVEHQWEGTDGSLISKLETKMINTSEHSCLPWDWNTLLCPLCTCVCVCFCSCMSLIVHLRNICASTMSETCVRLWQHGCQRHPCCQRHTGRWHLPIIVFVGE